MLHFKPPAEKRISKKNGFVSILLSLLVHLGIAVLLWCFVITITKPQAIRLTGSTWKAQQSVTLNAPGPETQPTPKTRSNALPTTTASEDAAIDALIADVMQSSQLVSSQERLDIEPSIEFFGTKAIGNQFVFVLDTSYSMNARRGERFRRACDELLRSVTNLREDQSYYVFLFSWNYEEMFYKRDIEYVRVHKGHETKLRKWIYHVSLTAGTDPRRALALARRMEPDAVFLLSDGEFNRPRIPMSDSAWLDANDEILNLDVQQGVEKFYKNVPIHTISFENPFTKKAMSELSQATGGEFRYVKTESLEPIGVNQFAEKMKQLETKYRQIDDPKAEYQKRLFLAREFISDGELLFAEYVFRPLKDAPAAEILNPVLFSEIREILESDLGTARLEDFDHLPKLQDFLTVQSGT